MKIRGSGDYSLMVAGFIFNLTNAVKIPCYDSEYNYIKTIVGTTSDVVAAQDNKMTLNVSSQDIEDGVYYFGFSVYKDQVNNAQVVKSSVYPATYSYYYDTWKLNDSDNISDNPLYIKQVVFDGDSICQGSNSSTAEHGNGWAGRIGPDNHMIYFNIGQGGATITADTYFNDDPSTPRHWICRSIDTVENDYPDADYIILEGGTNDADLFYGDASKLGTFDPGDFTGPFDDTTFYGAMDSLCSKALTYYPKKKIGFVIAQKMGTGYGNAVKNRREFFDYAATVCRKWGIPVLDLWNDGQLRPDIITMYDPDYNTVETATAQGLCYYDGQHLTAYGYDVLSPKIEAWMKTL